MEKYISKRHKKIAVMTKRVNVSLDDKTHMLLKIVASMKDMTLAEYLEKAAEKSLSEDKKILEKLKEELP